MALFIPSLRATRPDARTLRRRKLLVWQVAESLHRREAAHAARGHLGIERRLELELAHPGPGAPQPRQRRRALAITKETP